MDDDTESVQARSAQETRSGSEPARSGSERASSGGGTVMTAPSRDLSMVDELSMDAPIDRCFEAAADVERWPEILPHYRWVRFQEKEAFGTGVVEMAAFRSFGPLRYPVWWVSRMSVHPDRPEVIYRHIDGITAEMDVVWSFEARGPNLTHVRIVHEWDDGPAWPVPLALRRWIARRVIGPIFIHHVASRTLAGVRAHSERGTQSDLESRS